MKISKEQQKDINEIQKEQAKYAKMGQDYLYGVTK